MGVVQDVQDYLEGQAIIGGVTGWSVSRRRVHGKVDRLVVLTEDGGPPPEMSSAVGMGDAASQFSGIQVRVRGAPHEGDVAQAKAREILDALHSKAGEFVGSTLYQGVWTMTSEPVPMGYDEKDRPEFTVSFRLMSPVPV